MEILVYSMKKAFLERAVVELVYKFDEKSTQVFEKVRRLLKCHSNFFEVTYIHTCLQYVNGHYPRSHNPCSRMRMWSRCFKKIFLAGSRSVCLFFCIGCGCALVSVAEIGILG